MKPERERERLERLGEMKLCERRVDAAVTQLEWRVQYGLIGPIGLFFIVPIWGIAVGVRKMLRWAIEADEHGY